MLFKMLILVAEYTLILCFSIELSVRKSCHMSSFQDSKDDRNLYEIAGCSGRCLINNSSYSFRDCYNFCTTLPSHGIRKPSPTSVAKINENLDLRLICRDDSSLVYRVIPHQKISNSNPKSLGGDERLIIHESNKRDMYVIKVHDADELFIYLSNSSLIEIDQLKANRTYNISVAVVYSSNEYSIVVNGRQQNTLPRRYRPEEIQGIELKTYEQDVHGDPMLLNAVITWKSSGDQTCHYDIICYPPDREDFELTPIEIRDPKDLFTYTIDSLTFGTIYNIGIRAKNTKDSSRESGLVWQNIVTPTCLNWYNNNITLCPPLTPEGLQVEEASSSVDDAISLNITWIRPPIDPEYYVLKILDLDQLHPEDSSSVVVNITQDQNSIFIPSIHLNGLAYEIHLTAYTTGGNASTMLTQHLINRLLISDRNPIFKLITAIIAPMIGLGIMALVIFIACNRRAKFRRYQERCKYFEELEKKAPVDPKSNFHFPTKTLPIPPSAQDLEKFHLQLEEKLFFDDAMEINKTDIELFEILGEGAFGLVRRGVYATTTGEHQEVAVKMLKDRPSIDEVRAFRREIEVMKSVGKHPNIVGIIGHYTKDIKEMLLLTEFCSLGNLLNFLRNEWRFLHEIKSKTLPSPETTKSFSHDIHQKQIENIFNFDMSLVKSQLKYKNINIMGNNSDNSETKAPMRNGSFLGDDEVSTTTSSKQLYSFNKSYGYSDVCTHSCKCQVEIVANNEGKNPSSSTESDQTSRPYPPTAQILIKNCQCKSRGSNSTPTMSVENKGYYRNFQQGYYHNSPAEENAGMQGARQPLTGSDLLHIAKQIALGMEFLSKNKVVHRDLAARNVLVCKDRTVKIADFGLSRDVYQENVYKKTGNGKLPIKWLALESMTHQLYTTKSDVWSFGILLYEIVTLGETPYPAIPTTRLLHLLKTGYRMEMPKNCAQPLYNLMVACWQENPGERPTFTEIRETLDSLLMNSPDEQIVNSVFYDNFKKTKSTSDDSYLKPV